VSAMVMLLNGLGGASRPMIFLAWGESRATVGL